MWPPPEVCLPPPYVDPDPEATEELKDRLHAFFLAREIRGPGGCLIFPGCGCIVVNGVQYCAARVAAWVYLAGFDISDRAVRVRHQVFSERPSWRGVCSPRCVFWPHLVRVHRISLAKSGLKADTIRRAAG